jgi:uncharacterized membrane protein YphA (DoxX/SURF4 family)
MIVKKEELPLNPERSGQSEERDLPKGWKAGLAALTSARLEMIRIEAKSASSAAIGRFALLLLGLFGLLSAWVLALAATIGAIAASTVWEWYHVAFASAGAHFLIGVILLLILKSGKKVSFPVTRAEFQKDREWLNRLNNQ